MEKYNTLKNKKELEKFVANMDFYIDDLLKYLNEYGLKGTSLEDFSEKNDSIQEFIENTYASMNDENKEKLRLGFWAFFIKLLINKLGGELILASKNDYCTGTPLLINYGNRFDKKGKRKWIAIGVDSWFNVITNKKMLGTLKGTVEHLIEQYS